MIDAAGESLAGQADWVPFGLTSGSQMTPYLAAVLSGLLMWASFPPLDWGLLAFLAPAPLLWVCRRADSGWMAAGLGFLTGAVFYGAMLYWLSVLGVVAWLPLTIVLAAYTTGYAVLVWAFRLWPAGRWWLIAVAGWGLIELVRAHFPLGGFPWGSLGFAAAGNPGFIGATQWIGPAGWGLLAVAVAAGVVLLIEGQENWRFVVDPLVVTLMLMLAGGLFPASADGPAVQVAIVQGGSPCPGTHCPDENRLIYESHIGLTRSIPEGGADLVVWPENALGTPYEPEENSEVRAAIETEARRLSAYILVSGTRVLDDQRFSNTNTFFGPTGSELGQYRKRHPVPFGEFVPLRPVFGFIPQLDQVPRDMVRGDGPVVFTTDRGLIGSVISFEGAFPRYLRDQAQAGGQLAVVATNESSYGVSPASDQLIGMTRVTAAAVGQDLVHSAITGKSAIIHADGRIVDNTEMLEEGVLYGEVRYRSAGPTVYSRFGDWPLIAVFAAAGIAMVLPGGRRKDQAAGSAIIRSAHVW